MHACQFYRALGHAVVVFIFMSAYGMFLHCYLLADIYAQIQHSTHLFRSPFDMKPLVLWNYAGNATLALVISLVYKKHNKMRALYLSIPENAHKMKGKKIPGFFFGLYIGLIIGITQASFYSTLPVPPLMGLAWLFGGIFEGVLIGLLLAALNRGTAKTCVAPTTDKPAA